MTTDFVLWQWSLLTQLLSGAIIAGFFQVFARTFRTAEMQSWRGAWLANLVALLVTAADTFFISATPGVTLVAICISYLVSRALFIALLLEGLWHATSADGPPWSARQRTAAIAVIGVAGIAVISEYTLLGVVTHAMLCIGATYGTVVCLRQRNHPVRWLAPGFGLRALLSLAELLGYATSTTPPMLSLAWRSDVLESLLSASSFVDMSVEWLLVLGSVLAVTTRSQRELESTNADLRIAQESLRAIVDVDPLTGLANRRALPAILREVQPDGASIVFIDLHDFKQINDERGHLAGDEALRRFATALHEGFRPGDAVVRYAGDEFVVIARGLERGAIVARVEELRTRLAQSPPGPALSFDAGYADLEPGGVPDDAIQRADQAMYEVKMRARTTGGRARR